MKRTLNTTINRSKSEKNAEHKRFKAIFTVLSFAFLPFISVHAAEYTLDLRSAAPESAEEPVLRRASMPVAIGAVPAVSVGDSIDLRLFDDVQFALSIVSATPAGIAGQSFIAKDQNGSASAVVKVSPTKARISVDDFMNRRQYSVRVNNGIATIVERDNSYDEPGECGTCGGEVEIPEAGVEETKTTSTKKSRKLLAASGNEFPLADHKSVVDILVAFDQGAITRARWFFDYDEIDCDDEIPMLEFADWAVNKMNTVLVNSRLDDKFFYRLVGVAKIDAKWSVIDDNLLGSLRLREGKFAKLGQLREKYGADTITLLIDRNSNLSNTAGAGYEYSGSAGTTVEYFDSMNYACNVCDVNTVRSRYTMSHETGHNMGCGHSDRQGAKSGPGRYQDSCGYHFTDANNTNRYTIMAYEYTSPASGTYFPVPYFSTPDISPAEYGCALGVEGINNNRGTLLQTCADIAGLREHVLPYDWDVRVWEDNREIVDGDFFEYRTYGKHTLTLTHVNSEATIYYTLDGTEPDGTSSSVRSGETITVDLEEAVTLKVCAVIDGVAQSVRTITLQEGIVWSGEAGQNGNGCWTTDQSVRAWGSGDRPYEKWATCVFADITGNPSPVVTVAGEIAPWMTRFLASDTAYTFTGSDDSSMLKLRDAVFAPSGDVTFNVPVKLDAVAFTNIAGRVLTFNAPFGQTVDATSGYCTNMIGIGAGGTLTVAPGEGKTQYFDRFNNVGWYYQNATLRVGKGTVVFKGPSNDTRGLFGSIQVAVSNGGNLVFDVGSKDASVSVSTPSGKGWSIEPGGRLSVKSGTTLTVPEISVVQGAALSVPVASSAPLVIGSAIDLTGVAVSIEGSKISSGVMYPILHSDVGITGLDGVDTSFMPNFGGDGWKLEVDGNTLYAGTAAPADGTVALVSNVSGISLRMPVDAEVNDGGGAVIATSPIVVAPLDTKKVTVIAKIRVPDALPSEPATICSWKVGDYVIYCLRETDGTLNCRWINTDKALKTVSSQKSGTSLPPGEHILRIEYYSSSTEDDKGTQVFIDEIMAYRAEGLRFSALNVKCVAFGATAEDSPRFAYPGLLIREAIVIDEKSEAAATVISGQLPSVDVLVAYDLGAQAYVSGKSLSLEDFAATQIQKMNDVLATNRLERFYSYRLAGVCKVNDTYDNIDTAPAQAAGGNGAMVSLRAAREIYGADTVTLLVDTTGNTLGNSSPLNSPNNVASQHECAFSVCSIRAVDTGKQHTMIHENAHNMGCGHARAQIVVNSPFEYGRGYYFKDGNVTRHTIMAYGGDNDASWYFSTSSSKFGFKLGDETNDNARVLRETCSEVAKWREDGTINLDGGFASGDAVWQTGKKYPWSVDGEGFIRSYNQTEYGNQCTTPLKATVAGPAKIMFKHKSYFGGMSVAGNNYSHFDVLLDDSAVLTQTECTNSWNDAVVEIPEGDHEVTFVFSQRYAMNNSKDNKDVHPEADDAVWLKDISIVKKPVKTDYNFEIPGTDGWVLLSRDTAVNSWLDDQNFWMYDDDDDMSWQKFMEEKGANGYCNWENFLLGYSAEDPTQKFSAKIKVVDGKVTVETNEGDIPSGYGVVKRIFKKASLDSDWDPPEGEVMSGKSVTTDAADQGFYKVKVLVEPGQ